MAPRRRGVGISLAHLAARFVLLALSLLLPTGGLAARHFGHGSSSLSGASLRQVILQPDSDGGGGGGSSSGGGGGGGSISSSASGADSSVSSTGSISGSHIINRHGDGAAAVDPATPKPSIPQHIFAFWGKNSPQRETAFTELCMMTWRQLNPTWDIVVLNEDKIFDWVKPDDLPRKFHEMDHVTQTDAVRLAVLLRYGGVWLDGSIILLSPLEVLLGKHRTKRPWFHQDLRSKGRTIGDVENWFIAAPPNDPFLVKWMDCVKVFFRDKGTDPHRDYDGDPFTDSDRKLIAGDIGDPNFKPSDTLFVGGRPPAYLVGGSGCSLHVLNNDEKLKHWYQFETDVYAATKTSFRIWSTKDGHGTWTDPGWVDQIFHKKVEHWVRDLKNEPLIKFASNERKKAAATPRHDLLCGNTTFATLMHGIGIRCEDESRVPTIQSLVEQSAEGPFKRRSVVVTTPPPAVVVTPPRQPTS